MNHEKEQADLLAPLRALPTEVDLDQVAHMVAVFPLTPEPTSWLSTLSNNLNILIMTTSTLLLGLGLYLFGGNTQQAHTPPPVTPVEVIVPLVDSTPTAPVQVITPPIAVAPPAAPALAQAPVVVLEPVEPIEPLEIPEPLPYDPATSVVDVPHDWQPAPMTPAKYTPGQRSYEVKGFRGVEVLGSVNVTVEAGDFGVTASGEEEVLERLNVKVEGDRLRVYVQDKSETKTKKGLFGGTTTKTTSGSYGGDKLNITVRMPELESAQVMGSGSITFGEVNVGRRLSLKVQGSGQIRTNGAVSATDLEVSIQGSGHVDCARLEVTGSSAISVVGSGRATCEHINVAGSTSIKVQGSGSARVSGATDDLSVSLAGSGNVQAQGLTAKKTSVNLAGSGNVHVKESGNLSVQSAGSGKVRTGN